VKKTGLSKLTFTLFFLLSANYQLSFAQKMSTLYDGRDSSTYKTVSIGNQDWMAENLHFKMPNGCWCYNNESENCKKFGNLYNWEMAKEACPQGWHLPSKADFDTLVNFLGGDSVTGAKIRSRLFWKSKRVSRKKYMCIDKDACVHNSKNEKHFSVLVNSTNFSGLPAGGYYYGTTFDYMGLYGIWWTSSLFDKYNPIYYIIYDASSWMGSDKAISSCGFSVRCLKDK